MTKKSYEEMMKIVEENMTDELIDEVIEEMGLDKTKGKIKDEYEVREIDSSEAKEMIMNKHYAQRRPSISYAFGLFKEDELVGICTFGKPASNSLCVGICGEEYSKYVYELNRLFLEENKKNLASFFISKCLKQLKSERLIIVSYSDTGMNHNGYIYQASNFVYTGQTKERTDKFTEGNKHSRHYDDNNQHLRKVRTSKHRYVYFTDRRMMKYLNYPILPYPKAENKNYTVGERQKTMVINKETGEKFFY